VFSPGGTPPAVLERLGVQFAKATKAPRVQTVLRKLVFLPVGSTPAEFSETIRSLKHRATEVFKALDIRPTEAPQ
jgi:tripartite-type tricarboxylate transporter receptor subunit TctC